MEPGAEVKKRSLIGDSLFVALQLGVPLYATDEDAVYEMHGVGQIHYPDGVAFSMVEVRRGPRFKWKKYPLHDKKHLGDATSRCGWAQQPDGGFKWVVK